MSSIGRRYARNNSKTNFFVNTELITASDKYDSNGNASMVEWVAGGYNNDTGKAVIAYSPDGKTWTNSNSLDSTFGSGYVKAIAWNGSIWVAGGNGNSKPVIAYSPDGINWTSSESLDHIFVGNYGNVNAIAWNGSLWLAGGYTDYRTVIAYSADGINWTSSESLDSTFGSGYVNAIAWNGSLWLAGGYGNPGGSYKAVIAYSANGINWTNPDLLDSTFGSGDVNAIAWNGSRWIAGGEGDGGVIAYSSDGINWTNSNSLGDIFNNDDYGYVQAIACDVSKYVAAGYDSPDDENHRSAVTSADGINWLAPNSSLASVIGRGHLNAIAANGYKWVTGGYNSDDDDDDPNRSILAYSSDAYNWLASDSLTSIFGSFGNGRVNAIASTRGLVPLTGALPNTLLCSSQGKTVKAKGNTFVKVAPVNSSSESDSFYFKLEDHKFASLIR